MGGREAQSVEGSGPAGQHRELHVTQLSMTTRERGRWGWWRWWGGTRVAGDKVRETEGERERERQREHGKAQLRSESAQLEQSVKNKAPSDFHPPPPFVCFTLSTDVSLFSSLEIKEL